ncbi:MBL fold metallo-hydrolase [Niallia sp. XMNu-256]|uniref:MBL fold metallo-hydrolase n=1 Tax=Niallia sp. XMNu-256 TaxID=3082444 RepID=UPI0030D04487
MDVISMIIWKDHYTTIFRSALYETTSTVISTDDCVIVVDPNWLPQEIADIKRYVDIIRKDRPLYLLFTHSDYDHIIGYRAFPDAKVIASGAFGRKPLTEKKQIIEEIHTFDDEYYISRDYSIEYPKVDIVIDGDGTTVDMGQTKLTFYQAPGHNNDGLFTVIEPIGLFISGDYFSDIEFPYIYYSGYEYEKTILKLNEILSQFDIQLLVTGHGNPTKDSSEIKKRQQESLHYIYQMREYISAKNEKGITDLIKNCRFPRNMKKFHHHNRLLIEKELEN